MSSSCRSFRWKVSCSAGRTRGLAPRLGRGAAGQQTNGKPTSPEGVITIVPNFSLILHDLAEARARGAPRTGKLERGEENDGGRRRGDERR